MKQKRVGVGRRNLKRTTHILHLRFKITMHDTLKMAKGNNIQYLSQDNFCFFLCVLPTSERAKRYLILIKLNIFAPNNFHSSPIGISGIQILNIHMYILKKMNTLTIFCLTALLLHTT